MSRQKILRTFEKVDRRFLKDLDSGEQGEAIEEFRRLWTEQKGKVSRVVDRRQKVHSNRQQQAVKLQDHASKIAADLKMRMEKHNKKKSVVQLQKLKLYKNMDRSWKDKVLQISIKVRNDQKKQFQKAKQISKEIQQFWENKRSLRTETSKLSHYHSQEFSPRKEEQSRQAEFLTEIRFSRNRHDGKRNARSVIEPNGLPTMEPNHKFKREVAVSRSVNVQRRRTENVEKINHHIMRSQQEWKKKEDTCFQKAMEKIDFIFKKRVKAREKLEQCSKQLKESSIMKQKMFKQKRNYRSQRNDHASLHYQRHKSQQQKFESRISAALQPYYNSKIQIRRKQIEQENSRLREEVFSVEKFKERRGKFHRMVRDAVNIFRLQALRHKN